MPLHIPRFAHVPGNYIDSGTQRSTIATDLLWADVCTGDEDTVLDKQGGFGPNERGEELVVCAERKEELFVLISRFLCLFWFHFMLTGRLSVRLPSTNSFAKLTVRF
jgi:hypothetical protein